MNTKLSRFKAAQRLAVSLKKTSFWAWGLAADNQSRPFGAANPPLTLSLTGFTNGESADVLDSPPNATTSATLDSPVQNKVTRHFSPIDSTNGTSLDAEAWKRGFAPVISCLRGGHVGWTTPQGQNGFWPRIL
jgi:hypothetical protein